MTATKKFNPSLGHAFADDRFGKDSVTLTITAENLDVAMKNLQIGSKILFRFNKQTQYGNNHYFAEIVPPKPEDKKATTKPAASSSAGNLD